MSNETSGHSQQVSPDPPPMWDDLFLVSSFPKPDVECYLVMRARKVELSYLCGPIIL